MGEKPTAADEEEARTMDKSSPMLKREAGGAPVEGQERYGGAQFAGGGMSTFREVPPATPVRPGPAQPGPGPADPGGPGPATGGGP